MDVRAADGKSLAFRFQRALPSGIRAINNRAIALEAQGHRVIHLEFGEPDFDTPSHIKDATWKALQAGMVRYTPTAGIPDLRSAIAGSYRQRGLEVDPAEVVVTTGATEALMHAMQVLLNPEDEVMVLTPAWVNYLQIPTLLQVRMNTVALREENRFHPNLTEMEAALTPRTRLLLLNNPHNPTGAVMSRAELEALAGFVVKHNLMVLSDEVYESISYGEQPVPLASLPGMRERTVTISSASKTFAMTGWRVGWAVAPREIAELIMRARMYTTSSGPGFVQMGLVAGLTGSREPLEQMVTEFDRRRKMMAQAISAIPGFRCREPEGAFYMYVNISGYGLTGDEMAGFLLEHAKVACVPGSAFGDGGGGYIRISYAIAYADLQEAVRRIALAVRDLTLINQEDGAGKAAPGSGPVKQDATGGQA